MYEDTLHDLRVKYDNTFVGLKLPGGTILPFCVTELYGDSDDEDIDPDDAENIPADRCVFAGRVWHNSEDFTHSWDMRLSIDDLELTYPRLGVSEVGLTAVMASRVANLGSPMKYRKAPTYEGISMLNPSQAEMRQASLVFDSGDALPEVLYAGWNNRAYRTIDDAVDQLIAGKRLGCALSPIYSLHLSSYDDNLHLAREGYFVGAYVPEHKQIFLNAEKLLDLSEELAELGFEVNKEEFAQVESLIEERSKNITYADTLHSIALDKIQLNTDAQHIWHSLIDHENLPDTDEGIDIFDEPVSFAYETMQLMEG